MGPPMSRPVPWAKMTASAPYFSLISLKRCFDRIQGLVPADALEPCPHPAPPLASGDG